MHDRLAEYLNHERTRRRTICSAIGIATSALMWPGRSAGAIRGWCRSDPVILVNGRLADITYDAPLDALLKVTGPTQVVVTVPYGVQASLVLAGPGFGWGEQVSFVNPTAVPTSDGETANEANGHSTGSEERNGRKKKGGRDKRSRKHKRQSSGKNSLTQSELLAKRDSVDVHVAVFVPAIEDMPLGVDFAPRLLRLLNPIRAEGSTNSWVTVAGRV